MDLLKQVQDIKREQLEVNYLLSMANNAKVEHDLTEAHRSIRTLQRKVRRLTVNERMNDQAETPNVD